MVEDWRPVAGFSNYEVSNFGRVRRVVPDSRNHACRVLTPWLNNKGYQIVTLCQGGIQRKVLVHRLVCWAFHGEPTSPDLDAAHGDGNPLNNCEGNLRWSTRAENMADCIDHGTRRTGARHWSRERPESIAKGEQHGRAMLCEEDVRTIRDAPFYIGLGRALAENYGVSTALISKIRNRKIWKHLS